MSSSIGESNPIWLGESDTEAFIRCFHVVCEDCGSSCRSFGPWTSVVAELVLGQSECHTESGGRRVCPSPCGFIVLVMFVG